MTTVTVFFLTPYCCRRADQPYPLLCPTLGTVCCKTSYHRFHCSNSGNDFKRFCFRSHTWTSYSFNCFVGLFSLL